MSDRWQDDPAYSLEPVPVVEAVSEDDPLLKVWRKFRDCCKAFGTQGTKEWDTARRVLAEWKYAIDKGTGLDWAKENRARFAKAMLHCGVTMEFEQSHTGPALAEACREVFECRPAYAEPSPVDTQPLPEVRVLNAEPKQPELDGGKE